MAKFQVVRGSTSNILDVFLPSSASTTGAGLTGLDNTSAGLLIAVKRELSSAYTVYTGNSTIQTITTIGTYVAPSASNCRFKVTDATNAAGVYQIMLADAIFGTSDASRWVTGIIWGATNLAPTPFEIQLVADSPEVAKPTNYASLSIDGSGRVDVIKVAGTTQTARDLGASVLVGDKTGFSLTQSFPTNFSSLSVDGSGRVDVIKVAGTTQTARDLGTSVLISSGVGTGQLNVTSGVVDANTTKVSGTTQTARDLGTSVLLSSGTGTGQLDFTSGIVKANTTQIEGSDATDQIATAILNYANGIESGLTVKQCLQLCASVLLGISSGFPTTTNIFKSADISANAIVGTKSRMTATTDSSGNRSAITTDLS